MDKIDEQTESNELTENINQMRVRHRFEIVELMQRCPHKNLTDWQPFDVLIKQPNGQLVKKQGGQVKKCKFCGKDIEHSRLVSPILNVKK